MNSPGEADGLRLNRFLADSGVASRRDADELIFSGQVTVNGQVARSPALRVDPRRDAVKLNGKRIWPQAAVYVLLNKPEGYISTVDDPGRRPTVLDLVRGVRSRVYPVGRLDINTSGLLLLTNDGDLAVRLTHPRYGFPKTYLAKVKGVPGRNALSKLAAGVRIPTAEGVYERTLPAKVRLVKQFKRNAMLEITLTEGRQHQVRKMCAAVGHSVIQLTRVKFGFLTLAHLPSGRWRYLAAEEVRRLQSSFKTPA